MSFLPLNKEDKIFTTIIRHPHRHAKERISSITPMVESSMPELKKMNQPIKNKEKPKIDYDHSQ